jgi:hypothetical protein
MWKVLIALTLAFTNTYARGPIHYCGIDKNVVVDTYAGGELQSSSQGYRCSYIADLPTFDIQYPDIQNSTEYVLSKQYLQDILDYNTDILRDDIVVNNLHKFYNCYSTDEGPVQDFHIGVALGSTFYNLVGGSHITALKYLENILIKTNEIYVQQFNIKIHVKHIMISTDDQTLWDNPGCSLTIGQQFSQFRSAPKPSNQGIWHIIDACYKVGDAIGLGEIGIACRGNVNALTYVASSRAFTTFVHEIGHNLGAGHHSEPGIMGGAGVTKILDGEFQFNAVSKDPICTNFEKTMTQCTNPGPSSSFWSVPDNNCGNGLVETNEECECLTGELLCDCCDNCKLRPEAECDSINNQCCQNCKISDSRITCFNFGKPGYCNNGYCEITQCDLINGIGDYCGTHANNPCKFSCKFQNQCNQLIGWTIGGQPLNHLKDGTLCETNTFKRGTCMSGNCLALPETTPSPTSNTPTKSTTLSPTLQPTKSPTSNAPTLSPTLQPTKSPTTSSPKPEVFGITQDNLIENNLCEGVMHFEQVFEELDIVIHCKSSEYLLTNKQQKNKNKGKLNVYKSKDKFVFQIELRTDSNLSIELEFLDHDTQLPVSLNAVNLYVFGLSHSSESIAEYTEPNDVIMGNNVIQDCDTGVFRTLNSIKNKIPNKINKIFKDKFFNQTLILVYDVISTLEFTIINDDTRIKEAAFSFAVSRKS